VTESEDATASAAPPLDLEPLPWHAAAREQLATAVRNDRMPHGLIVRGPEGVGKERFAGTLAAATCCASPAAGLLPCGQCPECLLTRAGTHPDVHWLRPLEGKKSISIDAVRDACERLAMTSLRGGRRVLVASPAGAMTHAAQNAMLKTLEEPMPRTLLVLVTSRPSRLLPTLRSRCQSVELARPTGQATTAWLEAKLDGPVPAGLVDLAGGAPFRALELAPHYEPLEAQMCAVLEHVLSGDVDVTRPAADMQGEGLPVRLDWLEAWIGGVVRRQVVPDATRLTFPGARVLQRGAPAVNISAAFRMLDQLREARRLLEGSAAPQLVVEALLIDLKAAFGRKGAAAR
jgi:DNA polymerase-3 subunit delta'